MSKRKGKKSARYPASMGYGTGVKPPVGFADRNLLGTDPEKEQFAPTAACPIKSRHRMGGMT